jgi:uncharacterized protein YcfJ
MKTLITRTIILVGVACLATTVQAKSYYDYAKVKSVRAVYKNVVVSHPTEQCYQVEYRSRGQDPVPTIAGSIIGGVIGHAIGDSRASTVAGAIIGGAIAHDSQHRVRRVEERCEVVDYQLETIRKLKGYKVKYRYKGETYQTFMKKHPGDKVKVRVKVSPVYYP